MLMRRFVPFALAVVAASFLAVQAQAKGAGLQGQVGPGFEIHLKQNGKAVKTLKPGTYTIKIEDKASIHDFHLVGPGVNKSTTVAFVGERVWRVTLKKGTYKFMCDPHSFQMHGSFTVR
jgi:plastocyanin